MAEMHLAFQQKLLQLQKENNEKEQYFLELRRKDQAREQKAREQAETIKKLQVELELASRSKQLDRAELMTDLDGIHQMKAS